MDFKTGIMPFLQAIKKAASVDAAFYSVSNKAHAYILFCLDRNDILSLRTFLALSNSELDFLTFGQGFEA